MRTIFLPVALSILLTMALACTTFSPAEDTTINDPGQSDVQTDTGADVTTLDVTPDVETDLIEDTGRDLVEEIRDTTEPFPDIPPIECASNLACERAYPDLPICYHAFCDEYSGICLVGPWRDGTPCDSPNQCIRDATCLSGVCTGPAVDCDDKNPCTSDSCDPEEGCMHVSVSAECEDGNPCTAGDSCVNGSCRPGPNSCSCSEHSDCLEHEDGNACNGELRCYGSKCVIDKSTIPQCEGSQDFCLANVCNPESGDCEQTAVNEGSRCDDGDACTVNDVCRGGICMGDNDLCDDDNVCTTDTCSVAEGCMHEFNAEPCDDGNACTENDTCVAGICVGTRLPECGCVLSSECAQFEDDNLCNGTLACINNRCVVDPSSVVKCSDPFDKPCQRSKCNPLTGRCAVSPLENGRPCADANSCTYDEYCQEGECIGTEIPCVDDNICTDDYCDEFGGCFHAYNTAPCEDNNPCTVNDHCVNGICVAGEARDCSDGKPCTIDKCSPTTGCYSTPITEPDVPCESTDPCVLEATCQNGLCVGDRKDCEDGDACTDNWCDSTDGECKVRFNSSPCDNGNECTVNDYCVNGTCKAGSPRDCSDTDPCTADRCIEGVGCVNEAITGCQHCPSGLDSECVSPYLCKIGVCNMESDPLGRCEWITDPCDDGNPCTTGVCNEWNGVCSYTGVSGECDDGNPCTLFDICNTTTMECVGIDVVCDDADPCTDDYCDTADGECKTSFNTAPCDDDVPCTIEDTCNQGVCAGVDKNCEDGDPCTDNFCDPITGNCHSTINAAECEDGDPCTVGDYCELGRCLTGSPKNCSDNNVCTADSCRADDGECLHDPLPGYPCGEENLCIISGICNDQGGCDADYKICDDGNPCTTDSCNPTSGLCIFVPNTLSCDDNNACTENDVCFNGMCSGADIVCDDNVECTNNSCDPATGCVFTPIDSACDDSNECTVDTCSPVNGCVITPLPDSPATGCDDDNPCTLNDICIGGECKGTGRDCNDSIRCTNDYCDTANGECVNEYFIGPCDDGNPCTTGDTCSEAGVCSGTAVVCNDDIACTTDYCEQGVGCVYVPVNGACDDKNVCTVNECVPEVGCVFSPVTEPISCDDGDLCTTGDKCDTIEGVCAGTMKNCNDSNPCTADSCNKSTGQCTYSPVPGDCNDNIACTMNDQCISGICYGTPTDAQCDDNNACTTDVCSMAEKKCVYAYSGMSVCDDHDPCTENDVCVDVLCGGSLNCLLTGCSEDPRCQD